ncbi:DUF6207 family protein [Streptomyces sp. RLB1-33]|nr:DUF6207 family protein [Streptomyces sp. RLB1-33]
MRQSNDAHVAEPGLAVMEVAAADDQTALALQEVLATPASDPASAVRDRVPWFGRFSVQVLRAEHQGASPRRGFSVRRRPGKQQYVGRLQRLPCDRERPHGRQQRVIR